MVFAFVTAVL